MLGKRWIRWTVATLCVATLTGGGVPTAARSADGTPDKEAMGLNNRAHLDQPGERDKPTSGSDDSDEHNSVRTGAKVVSTASVGQYGINYRGGPVMVSGVNVYTIWYGNFGTTTTQSVINSFLGSLGGSPWYAINGGYRNSASQAVNPVLQLAGSISDTAYSLGKTLSDAQVQSLVSGAITSGKLPSDPNGQYLVLTAGDVAESSGFLTNYCGWHTAKTVGSTSIKYGFIGDPSKNLSVCAGQTTSSPNNNPAADAMISIIAHEIAEAATDPNLNAWYDRNGNENADKCSWTFGTTRKVANGSNANITLGGNDYLVQRNWKNVAPSGVCGMS